MKFSLLYCTGTPQKKPGALGEFISSSIGHVLYTDMQKCLLQWFPSWDKHTEGTNTRRDIHTEGLTHGGDTHNGVTRRGDTHREHAHDMEGTDTRRDMHTEGHTHGGDTHGGTYTWRDIQ